MEIILDNGKVFEFGQHGQEDFVYLMQTESNSVYLRLPDVPEEVLRELRDYKVKVQALTEELICKHHNKLFQIFTELNDEQGDY